MTNNASIRLDHYEEMYNLLLDLAKQRGFTTVEAAIRAHPIKGANMTCIATGARVHFANFDQVLPADIYAVENAFIVRVNATWPLESKQGLDIPVADATHEVDCNFGGGNEFWRDDLGVYVVSAANIRPVVKESTVSDQ